MASIKKAKPSKANGKPMIEPENLVKVGQSRPISNERIVPETAPMAKSKAKAFVQRRVGVIQAVSLCQRARPLAIQRRSGRAKTRGGKDVCESNEATHCATSS